MPSFPENKCPQCGAPLTSALLGGLCPACLLKNGTAPESAAEGGRRPFQPPTVAELAAKFPQLEVLELIGKGGMGAVYKARQRQLDRFVALKILPPGIGDDPAFAERFAREARALAKLNHPGIVTIYDFGRTDGLFYFFMEFVDGVNLRQLLGRDRISAREALAIVPQICDALQFAHDQGIVHRDIKPENILLDRRGRVKVADFGLAKLVEAGNEPEATGPATGSPALTESGKVMGTPQYMSPEQKKDPGQVDHRADIYAVGVVFYQMLTGEFPGEKIEPPSKKIEIDVRLDEIVLRALEKEPGLRYSQVSVLKTQVEAIGQTPAPAAVAKRPASKRIVTIAGLGLVAAIVLAAVLFFRGREADYRLLPGAVARWSGNDRAKDAVGGRDAVVSDGITYLPANKGTGFNFDGNENWIIVSNSPGLNFGRGEDFSIETWIKALPPPPFTTDDIVSIVDKRYTPDQRRCLGYELCLWGGKVRFHMSDSITGLGATWGPQNGGDLRDGKFHHLAVTITRSSRVGGKLYVDGQVVETFDPTDFDGDLSNDQPLRIGNHSCPDYRCFFHGLIGEVTLYRRALAGGEVQALYLAGGGHPSAGAGPPRISPRRSSGSRTNAWHPSGLVAWWPGDGDGDEPVNGNMAELTDVTFGEGRVGRAFSFNGVSSMIKVPANAAIDLSVGDGFTVMAWIKPNDVDGIHPILQWSDGNPLEIWMGIYPSDKAVLRGGFSQRIASYSVVSDQGTLQTNVFQHIAFTYDKASGIGILYVDGRVVAQQMFASNLIAHCHGDLWFSRRNDLPGNWSTGRMFSGLMDEIELYNRALSNAEIHSVYRAESQGQLPADTEKMLQMLQKNAD